LDMHMSALVPSDHGKCDVQIEEVGPAVDDSGSANGALD